MKRLAFCFFVLIVFVSPAFAHDKESHKGPKIEGKLLSLQGDKAEVQTKTEKVTVVLSTETKYESGAKGLPSTKADLKPGSDVMVHGHKLESGEFGATEIMSDTADEQGDSHTADHDDAEKGAAGSSHHAK